MNKHIVKKNSGFIVTLLLKRSGLLGVFCVSAKTMIAVLFFAGYLLVASQVATFDALAYSMTVTTSGDLMAKSRPVKNGEVSSTTVVADEVGVVSNCRAGYTLIMSGPSDNNLYLDGNAENNASGTFFAPVDNTNTLSSLANINRWGYSLLSNTGEGIFTALSNEDATLLTPAQTASDDSDIDMTTPIYYGVSVTNDILPGNYTFANEGAINYQVVMDATCVPGIFYEANGADAGEMETQNVDAGDEVILKAPNYSREGYGFVGWNTRPDGTGTNYGPNEKVIVPETGALTLYARWVESAGDLQGFSGCNTMEVGEVTALTDTRDGNVYAVAKLADGNCWMTENLRLDLSDNDVVINATNTNNPTTKFMTADLDELRARGSTWETNTGSTAEYLEKISFDDSNINRANEASDSMSGAYQWYAYGNYYNWYTATAGNGLHNTKNTAVAGDICPAGWHLPVGNVNGEFALLDNALDNKQNNWRKYPNNFVNSGYKVNTSYYARGGTRFDWTDTSYNWIGGAIYVQSYNTDNAASTGTAWSQYIGTSVRCIAGEAYTLSYNPNHDSPEGSEPLAPAPQVGKPVNGSYTFEVQAHGSNFGKFGLKFIGWSTDPNASQPSHQAGETITVTESNTILYAVWGCDDSATGVVCYEANGNDVIGKTFVQDRTIVGGSIAIGSGSYVTLTAPNYSRAGYGFAGWNTEADGSGTYYGSGAQQVSMPSSNYLKLYAIWTPVERDEHDDPVYMQDWRGCAAMEIGDTTALMDSRDGEVYTVTKLADDECWQTENLRLNLYDENVSITTSNTNNPSSQFISTDLATFRAQDEMWSYCSNTSDTACADKISMSTVRTTRGAVSDPINGAWYSYGNYYNWYTATAGNGRYADIDTRAAGDICPAGWHMVTAGRTNGDYEVLRSETSPLYYPANFVGAGYKLYWESPGLESINRTHLWSSIAYTESGQGYATPNAPGSLTTTFNTYKVNGLPIRCMATYPTKAILDASTNTKMKTLAEGVSTSSETNSAKIKAIKRAESLPAGFTADSSNTISTDKSKYPVYIFFDDSDGKGIMYYYSEADKIMIENGVYMFAHNTALTDISGLAEMDTSRSTTIASMFSGDSSLVDLTPLADWDVSKVKDMSEMLYYCTSVESLHGLEDWQTSSLKDTYQMFYHTTNLEDVSALLNWDTSKLESLSYYRTFAYSGIRTLHGLENWEFGEHVNESGVTVVPGMHETFAYAVNLTDISAAANWDMSKQTDRYYLFARTGITSLHGVENWTADIFNGQLDLTAFWYTDNLTDISALGGWDISEVTSLRYTFQNFTGLTNLDGLENWNVSNVQKMDYTFANLTNLTDISAIQNWNTSNVTDMSGMFSGTTSLTSADALNDWNIGNVTSFQSMFFNSPVHPEFTNRAGTWDSNGTFTPST